MPRTPNQPTEPTEVPYDERPFDEADMPEPAETTEMIEAPETVPDLGTETVRIDSERKVTWGYTRKKNLGNDAHGNPRYESEELSLYVTDMIPEDENPMAWVARQSPLAFDVIKAEVWSGLDLDFAYDAEGVPYLVPPSIGTRGLPPVVAPPMDAGTAGPPPDMGVVKGTPAMDPGLAGPSTRPTQPNNNPSVAQVGYYAPQPGFCKHCGHTTFYDNRAEGDAKIAARQKLGPDWKCQGCNKGVFRPGSFDYNKAVG